MVKRLNPAGMLYVQILKTNPMRIYLKESLTEEDGDTLQDVHIALMPYNRQKLFWKFLSICNFQAVILCTFSGECL